MLRHEPIVTIVLSVVYNVKPSNVQYHHASKQLQLQLKFKTKQTQTERERERERGGGRFNKPIGQTHFPGKKGKHI